MGAVVRHRRLSWITPLLAHLLMTTTAGAADPLRLDLPIMVKYSESNGRANWSAFIKKEAGMEMPALNAGDRLRIVRTDPSNKPLGEWRQGFKRFSHRTCKRKFLFGKSCNDYYAHDKLTARRTPLPTSPEVDLKLIFVNALTLERWSLGDRLIREIIGGPWVDAKGPLEMDIIAGISYPLPQDSDFKKPPNAEREGALTNASLGQSGPEQWITVTVEVEAGRRN